MKCPTLIAAIARDLEEGHACILQIVSTNEALLDRRLAEIPTSEWTDLSIDIITPREYVLNYLSRSFPTPLFELHSDDEGNLHSRPAVDAKGNPVISREAVERRDRMIEHLASLAPVQGALGPDHPSIPAILREQLSYRHRSAAAMAWFADDF